MDNIIAQVENFLLKNAWGVIIAGIIASMFGTLLCYVFRLFLDYIREKYKVKKNKRKTIDYAMNFYRGAVAEYSKCSSYRQILLVGDYIIDTLSIGIKIVVYLSITIIFIIISGNVFLDLTIITIGSFVIYPQFSSLKEIKRSYKQTYDYIFGEDFTQKCIDGAFETLKKHNSEKDDVPNDKS